MHTNSCKHLLGTAGCTQFAFGVSIKVVINANNSNATVPDRVYFINSDLVILHVCKRCATHNEWVHI